MTGRRIAKKTSGKPCRPGHSRCERIERGGASVSLQCDVLADTEREWKSDPRCFRTPEECREAESHARDAAASLHIPVLLSHVLSFFVPKAGMRCLDATLGLGGHASELLLKAQAEGCADVQLLGLDRDRSALRLAAERLAPFSTRVHLRHTRFSDCGQALDELGWSGVDFALADIGVSSMQLDKDERGFSFVGDGPLDMRMDQGSGRSAAALVNSLSVERLKEIIERYGEDPMAGRIARAIDDARSRAPIESTRELAAVIEQAYPAKWRAKSRNHPATRTFQALRVLVNDELGELEAFLQTMTQRLNPGGRLAVITFHSLEDRMVKHFFRQEAATCLCPPHIPVCVCGHSPSLTVLTRKPVTPDATEVAANPRASSAKLRVAEKAPER